jgi:GNAT superfamily N-acetyltransferase
MALAKDRKMADPIRIIDRNMTPVELELEKRGFDNHSVDSGVEIQSSDRMGFVALVGKMFVGCVSGLAYKNGAEFSGWFNLTDLFVEKEHRFQGIGTELLDALESKLLHHGVRQIMTWTAAYEAPEFYKKQGYEVFVELENWYSNGDSRVGLKKNLS